MLRTEAIVKVEGRKGNARQPVRCIVTRATQVITHCRENKYKKEKLGRKVHGVTAATKE